MGKNKKEETSTSSDDSDVSSSSSQSDSSSNSDDEDIKTSKKLKLAAKKRAKEQKKKEKKKLKKKKKNKITKEDYYNKNTEFRTWLQEVKKIHFEKLSSDKAKQYFKKFVKQWNKGKLAKKYYRGIDLYEEPTALRTGHRWSFAEQATNDEELSFVRDKVAGWNQKVTFSTFGKAAGRKALEMMKGKSPSKETQKATDSLAGHGDIFIGPVLPSSTSSIDGTEPASSSINTTGPVRPFSTSSVKKTSEDDLKQPDSRKRRHNPSSKTNAYAEKLSNYQETEAAKVQAILSIAKASNNPNALWKPK